MSRILLLLLCFSSLFFSCKRQKVSLAVSVDEATEFSVQEIDFLWFSSKAKVHFKDSFNDLNVTVNFRIKKDSVIWMSVSPALGIEAARCMITADSIFIMDKINNNYYSYALDYLSERFNVRMGLKEIQAMLMGNLLFPQAAQDKIREDKSAGLWLLTQHKENILADNYIACSTKCLDKVSMRENSLNSHLLIKYDNFAPLGEYLFPFTNFISINYSEGEASQQTDISISHGKAEFPDKALSFPFNVPKKYESK